MIKISMRVCLSHKVQERQERIGRVSFGHKGQERQER